jgi:cytoskeletal protein CcmA (bactofilin family)
MWGEATKTDEGVKVNLKYLTAMMRIELGQLPAERPQIRVSAYADQACKNPLWITGSFKAVVSEDDEINPDAQLNSIKGGGSTPNTNQMTIAFNGWDADEWEAVRKDGGFVYLPLIAQEYGALVFEYSLDNGTTWEFMSKTKPFTAKRGTMIRTNVKEFEIAGSDIESVNALLEAKKDETGAIVVSTTQVTVLDNAADGTPKNVIVIPAGMKAESLTLDLAGLDATAGLPFEIESADGKFAGDVIIDLSDGNIIAPANNNVYLNLPNSNVTVKGDFNKFSFGRVGKATQDGLIVKSIKFADVDEDNLDKGHAHTAARNIIPDYASFVGGGSIEVGEGVIVNNIDLRSEGEKNETVKECTIKIDGTANNIDADVLVNPEYKASIPANDKKSFHVLNTVEIGEKGIVTGTIATAGDVKIAGDASASGTITTSWGNVELSGEAKAADIVATNGTITASGKAAVNDLTSKGDITLSEDVVVRDVTSDEGNIVVSGKAKGKDLTATKGTITVSEDAVVDDLNAKGDITISGNSEVGSVTSAGNITISDKAKAPAAGANFTATGKESKITINTEGVINGAVTAPEVAVSSKAEVKNTTTTDKLSLTGTASLQNVNLNEKGTATINLDAEGEAIKGSLTLGGENKITLTQGYIFDITGADGELTFDKGEGFTAIASITATGLKFANASTWNGKKIGKDFTAKYAHQYPMTGCMLASWDFSAATTLLNDIDLNKETWTPVEVKTAIAINGNKKTIKNVKVDASADNAGLFATLADGASVSDLTIDGITVTSTKSNVGALVGKTLGNATFNKVTVKAATLTGGEASDNIGGIVGLVGNTAATDKINFTDINVAATITGRYNLGGLMGQVDATEPHITKSKVDNTTFKVLGIKDPVIGSKSDAKAGSVGMYVGTANKSVYADAKNAGTDAIEGKRADLGFKANFEVISGTDWYFYYGCSGNNDCGIFTAGSYACGADTYTAGSAPAIQAATTAAMTAKYHNYRLKYDAFK